MKKGLLFIAFLLIGISLSAQITIYEYKDEKSKAYCTFELDYQLIPNAQGKGTRGLFRAFNYFDDLRYFEIAFYAKATSDGSGTIQIQMRPDFYNQTNWSKLIGEKEAMKDSAECYFTFELVADELTNTTTDEMREKILHHSTFSQKKFIDFSKLPTSYTKTSQVNWKMMHSDLRKILQTKDKEFSRKYDKPLK